VFIYVGIQSQGCALGVPTFVNGVSHAKNNITRATPPPSDRPGRAWAEKGIFFWAQKIKKTYQIFFFSEISARLSLSHVFHVFHARASAHAYPHVPHVYASWVTVIRVVGEFWRVANWVVG